MIKDRNDFKILVIEDNPGDFFLIEDYLKERIENPFIEHASNFQKATSLLSANSDYTIILLDLTLPDKSGYDLINEIVKISSGTPIVVLSGFSDLQFSLQAISLGVSDYLLKNDLNASSLYKTIIYCLERRKRMLQMKESEKRYSELFRLNPQPIWIFELETFRFMQVNKAAIDLYGYSEEEFLNMTVFDVRLKEDIPQVKRALANVPEDGINFGKYRHLTKSKKLIDVEVKSTFVIIEGKKYRLAIITDVTEKNRMEHEITKAIIRTQENERYEIGAELHDNICQILATTHINLGVLKRSISDSGIGLFDQCREYINLATQEIRNLSHRLAPAFFSDSTLEEAFEILLNNCNVENKYNITLYFDEAIDNSNISRDLQLNLYRILQEQLRNILKYAHCKNIEVDLIIKNNKLKMRIADNGVGFDVNAAKKGIGLSNMKRRVELFYGKFKLYSAPGNGCEIAIDIPLKDENLNLRESEGSKFKD